MRTCFYDCDTAAGLRVSFRGSVAGFVLCACAALFCISHASAQQFPNGVFGPYSAVFLADGPGISAPVASGQNRAPSTPIPADVVAAGAHATLAFWFHPDTPIVTDAPTLLAGIGDPGAKDARFVMAQGDRLGLWLGADPTAHVLADLQIPVRPWHFIALVQNGDRFTLYADGQALVSMQRAQQTLTAKLELAPQSPQGHHFGGRIAYLNIYPAALESAQISSLAALVPDFDLPEYIEASAHWPVQTRGMAGQLTPQDPATLPHGKGAIQKPVALPLTAADTTTRLAGANPWTIRGGWRLAAAPDVHATAEEISRAGFNAGGWMVATVPGTVLTTMIDRGIYPDPDYGLNNLAIPDTLARQDYWYRVEFKTPEHAVDRRFTLTFQGVNYAAEVWLNGHKLGGFTGAFLRGNFDVTQFLVQGSTNALAVRVSPPPHPGLAQEESIKAGPGENGGVQVLDGPTFSATEGWDWIPTIRDRNTGIWQDVMLTASGAVSVGDLNVITTLPKHDNSEADLEIEAPLENATQSPIEGDLTAGFDDVRVTKHVIAQPGETTVRLEPAEFAQLKVQHPKLWWPNGYGDPNLHHLTVTFTADGQSSSQQQIDFGMREVSYELSLFDDTGHLRRVEVLPSRTHDESLPLIDSSHEGIREIDDKTPNLDHPKMPDGRPVPPQYLEWMKHTWVHTLAPGALESPSVRPVEGGWPGTDLVLKVNGVRIAARGGNWGMDDSRKRVSMEHLEPYFRLHRDAHVNIIRDWMGQNTEESFYALADKYGLMVWNDFWESTQNYNLEAQDPQLFLQNARDAILHFRHHPSIVLWCGRNEGVPQPIINEGLAELVRTLDHTRYYTGSSNQVNLRNSGPYQLQPLSTYYLINRGFSVELGIPSVPTLEGIKAFIPEPDRWPISDTWAYHDWHQQGNGTVKPFMDYMDKAFGAPTGLEDFVRKAQMIDYAAHRAIFEGFAAHLWQPNSARLIWMTQPAWPSTEWNFLGHDYDTQSSFYGTQKACEPVHAQLNLEDGAVDLINLHGARSYKVRTRVLALDGKVLYDQTNQVGAAADARTSVTKLALAQLANGHTVLVKLNVSDAAGVAVGDNFYWWAKDDATLRELDTLGKAALTTSATVASAGSERKVNVMLRNTGSTPAVLVKLTLQNATNGERILPAYYSENYVSLLPGEERKITIQFPAGSEMPQLGIRGWNVEQGTVAAQ